MQGKCQLIEEELMLQSLKEKVGGGVDPGNYRPTGLTSVLEKIQALRN